MRCQVPLRLLQSWVRVVDCHGIRDLHPRVGFIWTNCMHMCGRCIAMVHKLVHALGTRTRALYQDEGLHK